MRVFTQEMGAPGVTLTGYVQEPSKELQSADVRPAVLIFPGGGYFFCSDREAEPIALAYLAEGFNAFILRYSVGEAMRFPQPLTDAENALAYLKDHAAELHIDGDRVAVVGFSAGGHLAAWLGTCGRVRPAAMVLGYAVTLSSLRDLLKRELPSLDEEVDERTPPAFMLSTSEDTVVPVAHTLAFSAALDRAGIPFETHIYQRGVHGLSLAKPLTANGAAKLVQPEVAAWMGQSVTWLKRLLGDFPSDGELPT